MAVEPVPAAAENFSAELLRLYYDRIFPAQLMCRWLGYFTQHSSDPKTQLLHRREFSFTTGDDVYIRYLSYEDASALKKDLVSKLPHKIDIGAVFSAAPRDHKKYKLFEPQQRELIIDIDLTDYDFLEVDVKRLETCDRCWPLMALAMRVLQRALQYDFGFQHMLWVYSGRRGIHCWTCDTRARVMANEVRSAVADYLGPRLNAATGRLSVVTPMHPTLKSAYEEELEPFFMRVMLKEEPDGFGILDTPARQEKLLSMLGDDATKAKFLDEWERKPAGGTDRWHALCRHVRSLKNGRLSSALTEIIFTYTYPRLDVNVSKGMNHLLKSPWCVHPKTGRVCVPVAVADCEDFDPSAVPTLRSIADDLDGASGKDISSTRLSAYEAVFDSFLNGMEKSIRAERALEKKASLDF
uniref:DNA primase n=1 Tax=Chrysotila carterae TaxID=13221 RepID=A0A7S4B179_CHRCT